MGLTKNKMTISPNGNGPDVVEANEIQITHSVQLAEIPDANYVDRYIGRAFEGITDFELFGYAMEHGQNVLLEGPTGPGKTMSVKAFAAKHKLRFYSVPSNVGVEPSQMFGKYIPDESVPGSFIWQDGGVTDVVRNGGVLLINEINFMPPRVATALFGLLDDRREIVLLDHRGEVVRAHRGKGALGGCWCLLASADCDQRRVLVVGDLNPDYLGTSPLNLALRNRFGIQLDWDYDPNVEKQLVKSSTLLNVIATNMRKGLKEGAFTTPVSTNMLMEFEKVASQFGIALAVRIFVNHFQADERQAVKTVFDGVQSNLEREIPRTAIVVSNPNHTVFTRDGDWVITDRRKKG